MKNTALLLQLLALSSLFSCGTPDPNVNRAGTDELKSHEMHSQINLDTLTYQDDIYVPIYSDIYVDDQNQKRLLAATLSIRNTSFSDSIFVSRIDYFSTDGDLVRSYIENPIIIAPMGTINYVIEKEDDTGGPGANFVVSLSAKNADVRPLIQAIMIGETGNTSFAFSTDGYSMTRKK